jgi:general secretion pathway protein A
MYESFYGLNAAPFGVTPDPKFLLLTPTHREALHMLEYGVRARKGIILLLGDAGTGKTTLLRKSLALRLADANGDDADCVYVKNPRLAPNELFDQLASGFKLPASAIVSKARFLKLLEDALIARHAEGKTPALIVDEAQALSDDLVEELRLLANIESDDTKLLPLVLGAQPELAERLNQHRLRQFKQRITLRCQLSPFTAQETAMYIFGRVRLAGGDASTMFTREAVVAIHNTSKGIARTISVICDNALLTAFGMGRRKVDVTIVDEVCRDFDLIMAAAPDPESSNVAVAVATSGSVG